MIYFYSGTPGSGKSFHVAKDIYNKLFKHKKNVIANFDINQDIYNKKKKKGNFYFVENHNLSPEFFIQYAKDHHDLSSNAPENQTLVIIDECQLLFNPRTWNDKYRTDWVYFFTQHRKWKLNFILISQMDRLIDRQIRGLFEYEIKHRKVNNFKFGKLFPRPVFCAVEYWYGVKERVNSEFILYNKKYSNMYDTCKNFSE